MSVYVSSEVWGSSKATGTRLLVLLAYADRARAEDGVAWPSLGAVAKMARCSHRQAQYHARALVDMGELKVIREGGAGAGDTTVYQVTVGRFARVQPIAPSRVQPSAGKGATERQIRVQPIAPEPLIEPSENRQYTYNPLFEALWEASWKRGSKRKAERAYKARLREGADSSDLLTAVTNRAGEYERKRTEVDFQQHVSTFLGPDEHWRKFLEKPEHAASKPCNACGKPQPLTRLYTTRDGYFQYCGSCANSFQDSSRLMPYPEWQKWKAKQGLENGHRQVQEVREGEKAASGLEALTVTPPI